MLQDLNDISDGKIYKENDMVRVAANDCAGCHACCEGMGDTIILDPLDVHRLCAITGKRGLDSAESGNGRGKGAVCLFK